MLLYISIGFIILIAILYILIKSNKEKTLEKKQAEKEKLEIWRLNLPEFTDELNELLKDESKKSFDEDFNCVLTYYLKACDFLNIKPIASIEQINKILKNYPPYIEKANIKYRLFFTGEVITYEYINYQLNKTCKLKITDDEIKRDFSNIIYDSSKNSYYISGYHP